MSDYSPSQALADAADARRTATAPRPTPRAAVWVGALGLAMVGGFLGAPKPLGILAPLGTFVLVFAGHLARRGLGVGRRFSGPVISADLVGLAAILGLSGYLVVSGWQGRFGPLHWVATVVLFLLIGVAGEVRRARLFRRDNTQLAHSQHLLTEQRR